MNQTPAEYIQVAQQKIRMYLFITVCKAGKSVIQISALNSV